VSRALGGTGGSHGGPVTTPDCPPNTTWDPDVGACIPNCPPGTDYDPFTQQCIPICGDGFENDPATGKCVPIATPPVTGPVTNPLPAGTGTVNVTVNNAVTITDQILSQLSEAVKAAIRQAADEANQAAVDAAKTVSTSISGIVSGIGNGVNTLFGGITDVFKQIVSGVAGSIGDLVKFITGNIGDILSSIRDSLSSVVGTLATVVSKIATEIQQINDTLIQPVTTVILQTIQTISTLTSVIEKDLHDGITGILKIPTDISNGLTSLDATLQRSLEQLSANNKEAIDTTWKPMIDETVGQHIKGLGTAIAGSDATGTISTTFKDRTFLNDPNILQVTQQLFQSLHEYSGEMMKGLLPIGDDFWRSIQDGLGTEGGVINWLVGGAIYAALIAIGFSGEALPLISFLKAQANSRLPLEKLDASTALAAWLRQFIGTDTLDAELAFQGFDETRRQVLKDLQIQLLDVGTIIDMFYRGIVKEDDMRLNLLQHGISPPDQDALLAQSKRLFDLGNAVRAWRYDNLSDDQLKAILRTARWTDSEIEVFFSTALDQEGVNGIIERHKRQTLFSNHLVTDSTFAQLPGDVAAAAKRDGLDPQQALNAWQNQFAVPPLPYWISLYFRGIRTHTELMGAMDYFRVPSDWRDDYIRANQALIPFRTIPAMLASGIISEQYAKDTLTAHGFSLTDVNHLLDYAKLSKAKTAATAASGLKDLSLQSARTAWIDGAITTDQYKEILAAHGFDDHTAGLQIQIESFSQNLKARQQVAQDIVNEALAGLITNDQAQQQLAQGNYTVAEQAKYLKQLHRAKTAASKIPSLDDLHKFWKAQIIDETTFRSGVQALGYAQTWVDAFAALFNPSTTAATPTVPQTGGA
jgi:hypothetical protein